MKILFATLVLFFATASAKADQCAVVTYDVASRAAAMMEPGSIIMEFCPRCSASALIREIKVNTLAIEPWNALNTKGVYHQVVVNGESLDLAYVFVLPPGQHAKRDKGIVGQGYVRYKNVGYAAQCGADTAAHLTLNLTY